MAYHTPEVIAQTIGQCSYEILCIYVLAHGLNSLSRCILNLLIFQDPALLWSVLSLTPLQHNINCILLVCSSTMSLHSVCLSHFTIAICMHIIPAKQQALPWKVGVTHFSFFSPIVQLSIWHMVDIYLIFLDNYNFKTEIISSCYPMRKQYFRPKN